MKRRGAGDIPRRGASGWLVAPIAGALLLGSLLESRLASGSDDRPPSAERAAHRDLLRLPDGTRIATPDAWRRRRKEIEAAWKGYLGEVKSPAGALRPRVLDRVEIERGIRRTLLTLQVEPGVSMRCYAFEPPGEGPFPGCVVLHSTSDETIRQPAGLGAQPEKAFALDLARRGWVTIAPENFLWAYPIPEAKATGRSRFEARARAFLARHRGSTGMAKMLHDASSCVDWLLEQPNVREEAIGAIGHSLGAKEVMFLLAFDRRVAFGVSSEGGVGFDFSNWDAPWYLGARIRETAPPLAAEEIVALIAPRAWLLIGGGAADGERSRPILDAARPVWRCLGRPGALRLLVHARGHAVPPEARQAAFDWLERFARRGRRSG